MNFYDNRFDFLRVADKNFDTNETSGLSEEKFLKACNTYCLPLIKTKLPNPSGGFVEIGENNIVEGSTCFFVNTGDLFIYKKYINLTIGEEKGAWFKIGGIDEENGGKFDNITATYINPYFENSQPSLSPIG